MTRGRKSHKAPDAATKINTYAELGEIVASFAKGYLSLLVIVGRPGLCKSQTLKRTTVGMNALLVRGRKSPIDFYCDLFHKKDMPVVIDDADNLMSDKLCKEYVKLLTETDEFKRLDWGTNTKILKDNGAPKFFWTKSPVCIICNSWSSKDSVYQALESRAEFISFEPTWEEMYKEVGNWYWDQEIFDYSYERLTVLKSPDCRIFTKAYGRKKAGLERMNWQRLIDEYCDDEIGMAVRRLLDDKAYRTNTERAASFVTETGADRATFYRRMAEIKSYRPSTKPNRIVLARSTQTSTSRPVDGLIEGEEFNDDK